MLPTDSKIYYLEVKESELGTLPLFNAKYWAIGFLVFAVILAIIFGQTMPEFFKDAYNLK